MGALHLACLLRVLLSRPDSESRRVAALVSHRTWHRPFPRALFRRLLAAPPLGPGRPRAHGSVRRGLCSLERRRHLLLHLCRGSAAICRRTRNSGAAIARPDRRRGHWHMVVLPSLRMVSGIRGGHVCCDLRRQYLLCAAYAYV